MGEAEAVEALTELGLTAYEAKVFAGLQKLGDGSASEVSEVTDVPRSQVYGAAERLEEKGLVDVRQGTPTRYRPVGLAEARRRLFEGLEARGETAFDYLDSVQGQYEPDAEESEAIWTVHGRENVRDRAVSLVEGAERRVLYGTGNVDQLEAPLQEALAGHDEEVTVTATTADPEVEATLEGLDGVAVRPVPETLRPDISTGRILVVDDDTILLSVLPTENLPDRSAETAFWSEGTAFAHMLVAIVEEWFGRLGSLGGE